MKEKIADILISELDYTEYVAEITANDLVNIQLQLQPALQKWLHNREVTDMEIMGFSIKGLMEQRDFTFPSALIAMDWLLAEPDIAKENLADEIKR